MFERLSSETKQAIVTAQLCGLGSGSERGLPAACAWPRGQRSALAGRGVAMGSVKPKAAHSATPRPASFVGDHGGAGTGTLFSVLLEVIARVRGVPARRG